MWHKILGAVDNTYTPTVVKLFQTILNVKKYN